jgi:pimeloyl-ACP methyl ester carboxylesterase/acyl carrier protein
MDVCIPPTKIELLRQVRAGTLTADAAIDLLKRQLSSVPVAVGPTAVQGQSWEDAFLGELIGLIGELLHVESHAIDLDTPVADMGLDSLSATEFNNKMRARFGIGLQATAFFECSTVRDFWRYMLRIFPKQLETHYAAPAVQAATAPALLAAPAPAVPRATGDPIRSALDRIWRRAEQELDAQGNAGPERAAPRLKVERLLIERPNRPTIEVCSAGTGRPLLLLGGLMNPEGIWHRQIRALAPEFHVLIFNKPGCGRSGVDIRHLSLATIVDDILHVLDRLNLHDPIPVIGFSFGGMVAQALAVRDPWKFSALALINSAACHRPRPDEVRILIDEVARCPEVAVINGDVNFALAANYREVMKSFDLRDALPALAHPALVLSADQDSYIPRERALELAHLLKGAKHVAIPDAGHFSLLTHADAVNAHLQAFFGAGQARGPQSRALVSEVLAK